MISLLMHYFCFVLWRQVEQQQPFKKVKVGVRGGIQGGASGRRRQDKKQRVSSGYNVSSHDYGISASWIMLQSNGWCSPTFKILVTSRLLTWLSQRWRCIYQTNRTNWERFIHLEGFGRSKRHHCRRRLNQTRTN